MFNQKSHLFLSRQMRARAARGCQANVCAGPATRSYRQRPHVPRAAPGRACRRRLLRPKTRASRRRGDQRCQSPQPAARASPMALEGAAGGGAARSPRRCLRAPDSPGARGNGAAESPQRTPTPPTRTRPIHCLTLTHTRVHTLNTPTHGHTLPPTRAQHTRMHNPHPHTHVHTRRYTPAHSRSPLRTHTCLSHTLHMHMRTSTQR